MRETPHFAVIAAAEWPLCAFRSGYLLQTEREELFVDRCSRMLRTDTNSLRALPYRLS